ncbi:hypothetical protein [Chelatococcus reniformis]|uniref:Uncharacterized protein n=1 Tax=Chelatococcus reniformis TaxID=1494448 RepID=A0A916U068_9HYPH|nr:hypothetical protein [Chelatococcus reniformis]GGC50743.1 hypothetical protein GCM10010994_07360 [Chelatococcus reniformis]
MRYAFVTVTALALAGMTLATVAEAREAKRTPQRYREITVTGRSFLDPGPVVPVGSTNRYVTAGQYYAVRPNFAGPQQQSPLPQMPFDVPGRPFSPPAALTP